MSLWSWVKGLFRSELKRDVALLGGDEIDVIEEKVDLSGGPLRPNHRRRALRDRRLLPKKPVVWPAKRKSVMAREEAERLFSRTLRNRDRNARDLLPDEDQLARFGLPLWRTEDDVAKALGISKKTLHYFSTHREDDRVFHYVQFAIAKRSGGERILMAPKSRLKAIQRKLHVELVSRLPVSEHAHGFRAGRSVRTGAEPHVGRAVVLKMDLRDFFPSVRFSRVRGLLIALGYGYPVATTLAVLMTEAERQPVVIDNRTHFVPVSERYCVQGAPTSPGLCNAIAHKLDRRLAGLARKHGFAYTRYADDLSFSGDDAMVIGRLRRIATEIISSEGFAVNEKKTRVMRRSAGQRVTGVTVNDQLGLSRRERRRLRALIHQHGAEPEQRAHIQGKLAYLRMLSPEQAAPLEAQLKVRLQDE